MLAKSDGVLTYAPSEQALKGARGQPNETPERCATVQEAAAQYWGS